MKKIEKLTPEQERIMLEKKKFWLDYINSCKHTIDREEAKIGIDWLYQSIGKKAPIILFVDSPLACQYAVPYTSALLSAFGKNLSGDQVRDQVWDQVRDQVGAQVWVQVRDQVRDQVRAQVRDQVWDQVRDQVWAQVWDQVGDQVRDQVGDQVWVQVRAQVWDQVRDQKLQWREFTGGQGGSVWDYGWVSFHDFFDAIGVTSHDGFRKFKRILLSGVYDMIQLDGLCIVSALPTTLKRNASEALHCTDGAAVEFADGSQYFFVNGRGISEKYFRSISDKSYKMEDFVNEENEEQKSICIALMQEKYGDEYLVRFFREHLKELDTYTNKKEKQYLVGTTGGMNVGVYTLFKGDINGENIAYVRCYCPSTDRMFFLGVDSRYDNAKDAIASLYRIPKKLKPHIKSISRQGERFSTVLDDEGKGLLEGLSEKEIANVAAIDGDTYFKKMQYEY